LSASLDPILTLTGKLGFTVVVMALELAGVPVAHVAFDVNSTTTASPLDNDAVV
jgi:hypothetical protein